jgi:hypothetical protein
MWREAGLETENTAVGICRADHATPYIRKSRQQAAVARSI